MNWKRAVIKVGSALISPNANNGSDKHISSIADFIIECCKQGKEIILVSSGSVSAGRVFIHHGSPVPSIATKQAMAAVGQMKMMASWQRHFHFPISQLLITHGDLKDRQRFINIKNTIRILLSNDILPVINENDTVATEELRIGDNDNLAALVAQIGEADCLFILSDVDGVFDQDPRKNPDAKLLSEISEINDEIYAVASGTTNVIATGGMTTKIQAAEKATENGIDTFILNGSNPDVFQKLLAGDNPGTHFIAQPSAIKARKHWLKHTLKSKGIIEVDMGARRALLEKGASLLAPGIVNVSGEFATGDTVDILVKNKEQINDNGQKIAKGICQYSSNDLRRIMGKQSSQITETLGFCPSKEIVHRDDMVLLETLK